MSDRALSLENPLNEKLSHTQFKLMAFLLLVATKVCTLPTFITGVVGAKAMWVVGIACVWDVVALGFALQVAKQGGLTKLNLPRWVTAAAGAVFAGFFFLKLTAFSREISTYFAMSLFENVPVAAISILLLAACSMGARKGFSGIARVEEIFIWVLVFVVFFVLIFTRTSGDVYNLLAIFNGDTDRFGKGLFRCLGWFGDVCLVMFFDLSNSGGDNARRSLSQKAIVQADTVQSKHHISYIMQPSLCGLAILLVFYCVFISVYGEAAGLTRYAFIKLSAFKANTDELGSADWPLIVLWAIFSAFYLAIVLEAIKECCRSVKPFDENKKSIRYAIFAIVSVGATLLGVRIANMQNFISQTMCITTIVAYALTIVLGVCGVLQKNKGEQKD